MIKFVWSLALGVTSICALAANLLDPNIRDQLTKQELITSPEAKPDLVPNVYFMPIGESGEAHHQLSGRLTIDGGEGFFGGGRFPSVSVDFFSVDGYLVPKQRDLISEPTSTFDIIFSPGRIWSEPDDEGWSRASFPFVLAGRTFNESHNGLATFLYNDTQVSQIRVQVVQEAASWSRFDAVSQLKLTYSPAVIPGADEFRAELQRQVPMRPLSDLTGRVDPATLAGFEGTGGHVSFAGLFADGVLFAQPCRSRQGDYPYCREMRHGVFSVTKTTGAALSLFWLAEMYGIDVVDEKIVDHLDVTADHEGWKDVTFMHTLNMMTGVGDEAPEVNPHVYEFEADEEGRVFWKASNAKSVKDKLAAAFEAGNYAWGPGEVGRYNSIHTFVLAAAMDAYLKKQEGSDAHLWQRVTEEVLNPIGVTVAPLMHTRETDNSQGVPIMGWGFFPTAEDLARIAQLLHYRGEYQGRQLISRSLVEAVLFKASPPGYSVFWVNDHGRYHYHQSFWLMPFTGRGGCKLWLPGMSGYGGNVVTLMPNGMTGIRLADANENTEGMYDGIPMAKVADQMRPFCD